MRTGDRGVGRHGERRETFEPGVDIRAKVTILADGVRGNLTKQLIRRSRITVGNQPQVFALGIKELWDVPAARLPGGTVMHTLGISARSGGIRRRVHLRDVRRRGCRLASWRASTTKIRCSIRTSPSSNSSCTRL